MASYYHQLIGAEFLRRSAQRTLEVSQANLEAHPRPSAGGHHHRARRQPRSGRDRERPRKHRRRRAGLAGLAAGPDHPHRRRAKRGRARGRRRPSRGVAAGELGDHRRGPLAGPAGGASPGRRRRARTARGDPRAHPHPLGLDQRALHQRDVLRRPAPVLHRAARARLATGFLHDREPQRAGCGGGDRGGQRGAGAPRHPRPDLRRLAAGPRRHHQEPRLARPGKGRGAGLGVRPRALHRGRRHAARGRAGPARRLRRRCGAAAGRR